MSGERHIAFSETNFEQVYLIGFRVSPGAPEPEYYAIVLYNEVARKDKNRPLMHEGRIVLFSKPESADRILRSGDAAFRKYAPFAGDLSYVYDLPQIVNLLTKGEDDPGGQVVNFINELLDFAAAVAPALPWWAKKALEDLADHATFSRDLRAYFEDKPDSRTLTLDAVRWSIGAIVASAELRD